MQPIDFCIPEDVWGEEVRKCVFLCRCDEDLAKMCYSNLVVIDSNKIQLRFKYPLYEPLIAEITTDNTLGFTRAELVRKIYQIYREIYRYQEPYDLMSNLLLYQIKPLGEDLYEVVVKS